MATTMIGPMDPKGVDAALDIWIQEAQKARDGGYRLILHEDSGKLKTDYALTLLIQAAMASKDQTVRAKLDYLITLSDVTEGSEVDKLLREYLGTQGTVSAKRTGRQTKNGKTVTLGLEGSNKYSANGGVTVDANDGKVDGVIHLDDGTSVSVDSQYTGTTAPTDAAPDASVPDGGTATPDTDTGTQPVALGTDAEKAAGATLDAWIKRGQANTGTSRITIGPNTRQWQEVDPSLSMSLQDALKAGLDSSNPLLFRKALALLGVTTWSQEDPFFAQYNSRVMQITGAATPEEAWAKLTDANSAAVKDVWWDNSADGVAHDQSGNVTSSAYDISASYSPTLGNDFTGTWMENVPGAQNLMGSAGYSLFDQDGSALDGAVDPLFVSYMKANNMAPGAMMYRYGDDAKAFLNVYALVNSLQGNTGALTNVAAGDALGDALEQMIQGNQTMSPMRAWDDVLSNMGGFTTVSGEDNLTYSPEGVRSTLIQLLGSGVFTDMQKKVLYDKLQTAYMKYTTGDQQNESFTDYLINKMNAMNWI